ncbi:NADH dehydrogenase [ubiquinone] iron-sulfur protein 6, mitochondrial [Acrasis kona]|uniref:NADH dehydrogenase [ubiquinone] iron-sulfur protein 6, mitochondrial n=1 Tax=Acrasis kona TaxID=1008807 RepID=A0AAW2YVY4_9EUKA
MLSRRFLRTVHVAAIRRCYSNSEPVPIPRKENLPNQQNEEDDVDIFADIDPGLPTGVQYRQISSAFVMDGTTLPPIEVTHDVAVCDGSSRAGHGHPSEHIKVNYNFVERCGYCQKGFIKVHGNDHH